ncbi:unnamed protein product [Mucor hiemalis]
MLNEIKSKKVKCDFAHPHCARCQQAKADCSYDGSATQVDLFNLVKLNETVDILQQRVQSIETDIKDVCSNTQYVANEVRMNRVGGSGRDTVEEEEDRKEKSRVTAINKASNSVIRRNPVSTNLMNGLMATSNAQWQLSLTPKGLRIDTNIISLHDLYDILLSGITQFDLSGGNSCVHEGHLDNSSQSSSSSAAPESPRAETATVLKKKPLWKSRLKTFPLYSSWEPERSKLNGEATSQVYIIHDEETMQHMMQIFCECFLCLPCPNQANSVAERYKNGTLDPLLANSVFAWTARHAAIYHDLFPGKDPNQVGKPFFQKAKALVKDRFMKTSVDTMHSLIIMYIYAIGIPSEHKAEVESEAYIYLGLAIRMCLDLKMHQESRDSNPCEQEKNRRFFWSTYFLETLGSIHSDKPFSLPPKNVIKVQFPTVMEHEKSGESRYRVEFMIQRFKITRIYRDIIYKTAEEKPLFSQISAIDKELENWYAALPSYMRYEQGDIHKRRWDTVSFREQACIKLNFEYNFQLCQLYGLFFSKSSNEEEQPSTIEVLSREVCLKAARITVELLECWIQLRQRWCHFSLENLMMTTMIYGNILSQPNDSEREIAKQNLTKMAKILISAPVRHHKYVLTLVNRIKAIFLETLNVNLDLDIKKTDQSGEETGDKFIPTPQTVNQVIQPVALTNQYNQQPRTPMFNVLDVASASSAFDMHKTNNFSDFVYTPTVLDYATTTSNTAMIPHVMDPSTFGKKIDYADSASSPYNSYYSYNHESTNSIHSATPPHLHQQVHSQQRQQQFGTNTTPWLGMGAPLPTTTASAPILLNNNSTDESTRQPYMGMTYDERHLQKSTPPPPPLPSNVSHTSKNFYNNDNHNNNNGGSYF